MSMIKLLHAADLHLDSPFEGLGESKAAVRRTEQRQLLCRIAQLARTEQVQIVLQQNLGAEIRKGVAVQPKEAAQKCGHQT